MANTEEVKLLNCPFCGSSAKMVKKLWGTRIECSRWKANDHLISVEDEDEKMAIEKWNFRMKG